MSLKGSEGSTDSAVEKGSKKWKDYIRFELYETIISMEYNETIASNILRKSEKVEPLWTFITYSLRTELLSSESRQHERLDSADINSGGKYRGGRGAVYVRRIWSLLNDRLSFTITFKKTSNLCLSTKLIKKLAQNCVYIVYLCVCICVWVCVCVCVCVCFLLSLTKST